MSKSIPMNNETLKEHLCSIISDEFSFDARTSTFIIIPFYEGNKPHDGTDEVFRLVVLSEDNVGDKKLSFEDCLTLLQSFSPRFPTKVSIEKNSDASFNLFVSTRVRKASEMANSAERYFPFSIK